jgi:hypothetical protein
MPEYNCIECNYTSNNKTHYDRHCNTKKHIRICNINNSKIKYYKCSLCKYKTPRKDFYDNHIKNHLKQNNLKKLENPELIDQFIKFQTEMLNKIVEKCNKPAVTNYNNQNVYNYIVNNIKPTTNIDIEIDKPLTEKEIDIIKNNPVLEGSYLYIHGRFIDKRDNSERLIVCCDLSRNKFSYYNGDNKWVIDMNLKKFFKKIFDKIVNIHTSELEFNPIKDDVFKFIEYTGNKIERYEELKNILDNKQTKLLNKLYKDSRIDDKIIIEHQNKINN